MKRRLASSVILLPLIFLSIFYLTSPLFLLFMNAVTVLALVELFRLFRHYAASSYWLTYPLALALPWVWTYRSEILAVYLLLGTLVILGWSVFHSRTVKRGLPSAAANLLAFLYLGSPLAIAAVLQENARLELLLVLLVAWAGDTGAFFIGKLWGVHKVTPVVSPRKSLEGYVAAMLCSMVMAVLTGIVFFPNWAAGFLAAIGAVVGGAGIVGDLFESVIKRGADVKDSSNLIPGHGGVLDRIDSLLFAIPAYYAFSVFVRMGATAT